MRIEVQVDINEIIWENDLYGFISRECGTCRSFQIKMWESQSLRGLIKDRLEEETGHRPESWTFHRCFVVGGKQ
jgi:hypothetical protein|tara:strand:+ start:258 stop:479 length:222 start_codon:yes stop_codon:yes gene_type:complete